MRCMGWMGRKIFKKWKTAWHAQNWSQRVTCLYLENGLAVFRWLACCLVEYIDCVLINVIFMGFFSGDTYTDEFTFPQSTCTCTADITNGSYSMEFFKVQGYVLHMLSRMIFAH